MKYILFSLVVLLRQSAPAVAGDSQPALWSREWTDIFSPVFSPDGRSLAFVIQGHQPDGGELEFDTEKSRNKLREEVRQRTKANLRWADPRVVILNMKSKKLRDIDFGWSPNFSHDGRLLAYARQESVLTGFRTLADTMKGNPICLFHNDSGEIEVIARPANEYLDSPLFSPDGSLLAYCKGGHANGSMSGDLNAVLFDLKARTSRELPPPAGWVGEPFPKDMTIILGKAFSGRRLIVSYHQRAAKRGLAAYDPEVSVLKEMEDQDDKSNWEDGRICVLKNGDLCLCLNGWRNLTRDATFARLHEDPNDGNNEVFWSHHSEGMLSPSGRFLTRVDRNQLRIYDALKGMEVGSFPLKKGEVREVAWSPDEKALAVVTTPRDLLFTDELSVFEVDLVRKRK
jgi:WD40 repeat protein